LVQAYVTPTQLAGNSLSQYPFFEYVKAINENTTVEVAIDPTRFTDIVGKTCDIYVMNAKNAAQWAADPSLTDVTPGGAQTETFGGTTIQNNTFQVAGPNQLNADADLGLGVGYDVVLDCDQDGWLGDEDFIDGMSNEAGFYAVHDTTAAGPLAVTEVQYNLDAVVAASFGIPGSRLAEDLYYPSNVGSMGKLPLIVIGHGNGHQFRWYDHIGNHMASYGYIVMSHDNDTGPGPDHAATTTLGHTDAFIDQAEAGAIAGGALAGYIDTNRITWIGHSRGAEGVAIAYDRLFDGSHTPTHFRLKDIKLISSMLPTDFEGTDIANPHDANYHLWTASGDSDVNGSAGDLCGGRELCQTFHLHDRATRFRQSTVVQGTGHAWFHDGPETPDWFDGPCSIGPTNDLTHLILLGHFLPMIKHYVEGNIPALDFLTRQYESFRPIGVPTGNSCIVVTHEYRNGSAFDNFVIDDYQTETGKDKSSSGGGVIFDVENLAEDRLDDNNINFTWNASDPFNGATQAGLTDSLTVRNDTGRGVVFDWTDQARFYEWEVVSGKRDFSNYLFLSFRGAQGTQHPNTLAAPGDLTFSVTLRDTGGTTSSINIGAIGGGLEQPYQRRGGWHNEMETIRIRLTDFLNNGSGLNLNEIVAVRLSVGPSWGSSKGRVVVDEIMLTEKKPVLKKTVFKYSAKLVCGIQKDPNNMRLAQGFYATAINIQNPNQANVAFTKKLSLTYPPDRQAPGKILRISKDKLKEDQALEVDCIDIKRRLYPSGFPKPYIKGFVTITSTQALNVTAVYSTRSLEHKLCCSDSRSGKCCAPKNRKDCCFSYQQGNCCEKEVQPSCCKLGGGHSSIDVEQIIGKKIQIMHKPKKLPDLLPIEPKNTYSPFFLYKNGKLVVLIKNQGSMTSKETVSHVYYKNKLITPQEHTVATPRLKKGETVQLLFPWPDECSGATSFGSPTTLSTCSFRITADFGNTEEEELESNNVAEGFGSHPQ